MRPTGKLHLGNYVGALQNWVNLQKDYDNFFFIANWHALTTNLNTENIKSSILDMVMDWLSAGIDPVKSPVFVQSDVKEHAELHLLFSMMITVARLERNPTLKEQVRDLKSENIIYGHLGYPVLQAADILIYRANLVPVGEDQQSHVEITREIARKFNHTYAEVFPIPDAKMASFPRLPGLDGRKMSKSIGNTILMSDPPEEIVKKVKKAVTDPQKIRRNDPGHPDVCNVFTYHKVFNPSETDEIRKECEKGTLGCVDCKMKCAAKIGDYFAPMREKRLELEKSPDMVKDILADGAQRARKEAEKTMDLVREAMNLS
jgi:tryptophanyl-tRNA synthetase